MKTIKTILLLSLPVWLLASCGNSSNNQAATEDSTVTTTDTDISPNNTSTSTDDGMVLCPMCGGSGVYSSMPNDVMAPKLKCSGCNGTGKVDQETADRLNALMQQTQTNDNEQNTDNQYSDKDLCPNCHGAKVCTRCGGKGVIDYHGEYGQPDGVMTCPICNGDGKCTTCHGHGTCR
jgi:DnaJ-class molecular chaperone